MFNFPRYRGHGRGRGAYTPRRDAALPSDRHILVGLSSNSLQAIPNLSTQSSDKEVKITDIRYAGSYNWMEKPTPTIIIPGSPARWSNRATPYQVHPDDGVAFKDQNGYRCPNSTLLPLIVAVDYMSNVDHEEFDWAAIDFVTDRNSLRKLLRWIGGGASDFRIDTQLAGKTILLNRWENRYKEQMLGNTFGFNFERASTTTAHGCEGSTGHHRIIRYDLNGLKMVVRFEVDACIPTVTPESSVTTPRSVSPSTTNFDDLIDALSGVSLGTTSSTAPLPGVGTFPNITIIKGGTVVPQSSLVELTTRSIRNENSFDWKESYPQLFLSQTPHHFLAVHQYGHFHKVNKRKLDSAELNEVAAATIQADLKKLKRALDYIKELVVKHGERGRLSLVCQEGELRVFERTSQASCLPDDILQKFDL